MTRILIHLPLERPEDVYILRQNGRLCAAAIGLDDADQIRLATALSEIGRETVTRGSRGSALFTLEPSGALLIIVDNFPHSATTITGTSVGLNAARKLVDELTVHEGPNEQVVTLRLRRLPSASTRCPDIAQLKVALAKAKKSLPLEELRLENRDLISTLERLNTKRQQLLQLNRELEETNQGVMAMYTQLAGELEETNRGVVALYGEIDEKTQRLHQVSNAKSRFLASVSHELRSPVSSILGLSNLLLEDVTNSLTDDQRTQISFIHTSARELLNLVNELLDLAKAESGQLHPQPVQVDLNELCSQLRGSLRPMLHPDVDLEITCDNIPAIETDRVLLAQVLRNLLSNALKFTISGFVRLTIEHLTPEQLQIRVADTGIGIAPEDQERVFEEFYQVRGPLQTQHKGTGLGLAYVLRVVQALGGDMRLQSELGQGTTVTLNIPIIFRAESLPPAVAKSATPKDLHKLKIAIIDDDISCRTILLNIFHDLVASILQAEGGKAGFQAIERHRPDLVFLDLMMPDMDGAQVLSAMQADEHLRTIPVIVITSTELDPPIQASLKPAFAILKKTDLDRRILLDIVGRAIP